MTNFEEEITINEDIGQVWTVLADIGSIFRWNPGVISSSSPAGQVPGPGAVRRCELPGKRFLDEKVVSWEPGTKLTMRIVASNLPFQRADIHFTLKRLPGNRTHVRVAPDYALKFGWLGRVLNGLIVRAAYRKGMADLLHGLKGYVESCRPADQSGRELPLPV